jgi:hypothetical protein
MAVQIGVDIRADPLRYSRLVKLQKSLARLWPCIYRSGDRAGENEKSTDHAGRRPRRTQFRPMSEWLFYAAVGIGYVVIVGLWVWAITKEKTRRKGRL